MLSLRTGMLTYLSQYLECVLGPGSSGVKVEWRARSLIGADLFSSTATSCPDKTLAEPPSRSDLVPDFTRQAVPLRTRPVLLSAESNGSL